MGWTNRRQGTEHSVRQRILQRYSMFVKEFFVEFETRYSGFGELIVFFLDE
jgi:hypothetical protein